MTNNIESLRKELEQYKSRIEHLESEKRELGEMLIDANSENKELVKNARKSVKQQLSYRLGSVIVQKTKDKKILNYLSLPYALIKEYRNYKVDQASNSNFGLLSQKNSEIVKSYRKAGSFNYSRYIKEYLTTRETVEELYQKCNNFDVISFDIFDTALLRKVEYPVDIFDVVGVKIRSSEFSSARKKCEVKARENKFADSNTREITLNEIYEQMRLYGFGEKEKQIEISTEIESTLAHPVIFSLYKKLLEDNKRIVFTSDMYLPKDVIVEMLKKNGYTKFEKIFISNEYLKCKSDGSLQKELKKYFKNKRIIHIGDSLTSDKLQTEEVGVKGEWFPDVRIKIREPYLNNLGGSIYRAVINNNLNSGLWIKDKFYTHGFRIGGILTTGYCKFINEISNKERIDKILFCARDCDIINKVYNSLYKKKSSHYIDISRYAVMNLCPEKYASDILNRFIFRYWNENKNKTIHDILSDTGYGYLNSELDKYDIEEYQFCSSINKKRFEEFFLANIDKIQEFNKPYLEAAKDYYRGIIGKWNRILVVDIGWSGTCITALEYFLKKHIKHDIYIVGTLMCTSNKKEICNDILSRRIYSYICSPANNSDLERFMMPDRKSVEENDLLHMPLEYMFTSTSASLVRYEKKGNGIQFERDRNLPPNKYQIEQIQAGISEFCEIYKQYESDLKIDVGISPYSAFIPLKQIIEKREFVKDIYKDFLYDACTAPYAGRNGLKKFATLFPEDRENAIESKLDPARETILFISPEMIYAGAPRSLLRTAKIAQNLGYNVVVWTAKDGPFVKEFKENSINVEVVDIKKASSSLYTDVIKKSKLVYCNTIVTDDYVRLVKSLNKPLIWFIREATNIPDFCRTKKERLETLRKVDDIYCVSEYAANAIRKYTSRKISILRNCVEDEIDLALPYKHRNSEKVKFVQFGTIEYRKGYDVLLKAYKLLPQNIKSQAELYFAGGFVNSGTPFCSYLFTEMKDEENVHYLGLIQGEKDKIKILSQMDVIVVASRDESCSLVALEGSMLSKPLIVTENVGAKYIVENGNGVIVKTGDVESLKDAMEYMINNRSNFQAMGKQSRANYEKSASIEKHTNDIREAFSNAIYTPVHEIQERNIKINYPELLVSLTSYPARIKIAKETIESLINQDYEKFRIILWLSKEQFRKENATIPSELLALQNNRFNIEWVDEDLRPHKKYFYAVQKYPEYPLVIVDDDAIYDPQMLKVLAKSYLKHPDCISANRVNLIQFNRNKQFRKYTSWPMEYKALIDTPSFQLLPTGVGGVLYPPQSIGKEALNKDAIVKYCINADDLWLKINAVIMGYKTVLATDFVLPQIIEGSQETALWKENVYKTGNDVALTKIVEFLAEKKYNTNQLIEKIRQDRFA